MRFILKVDKEDCFKVAELKEITAVELLIINKALHLLSQNEEVAESDRYVAEKLGAELMRMDAVQRPLTTIDGADIADTPQTDCNANQCVQRVEYIGDIEKKHCRTCKHFESEFHTPISSDGTYYPYVICTAKECHYESVDTPQTDC